MLPKLPHTVSKPLSAQNVSEVSLWPRRAHFGGRIAPAFRYLEVSRSLHPPTLRSLDVLWCATVRLQFGPSTRQDSPVFDDTKQVPILAIKDFDILQWIGVEDE